MSTHEDMMDQATTHDQQAGCTDPARVDAPAAGRDDSRRDVVRRGLKLAFVAPVVTTFLASDAQAAASILSCYPLAHACTGADPEPCCPGLSCNVPAMMCE